jgi:hypothetical protein
MHREYVAQFGGLDSAAMRAEAAKPPPNRFLEVGDARYDITVQMIEAFGRPEAFANGLLVKFLRPLLGEDMRLSNFTIVVAHPGASQQHVHRDHGHLFFQPGVGPNLPVFAVNVAVPLVDVDIETGPTGILLGSHRSEQNSAKLANLTACTWRRGDLSHDARGPGQLQPAGTADRVYGLCLSMVLRRRESYQPNLLGHAARALQ